MLSVDIKFNSNSRPRGKLEQIGSGYRSQGLGSVRPMLSKLQDYEYVSIYDSVVSACIQTLITTLLSSLGEIEHPDPDIQDFLRYNFKLLEDERGVDLSMCLTHMIETSLWAGFSVTEQLFEIVENTLFLKDFVTYHPSTITIRPNKKGRLTEGEDSYAGLKSGIYQHGYNEPNVILPLWKVVHLVNNSTFGNLYGRSVIEPIYKWHLLKEAFVDMHSNALDRFGNPLMAIMLPLQRTDRTEIDPSTGEERTLTTQDALQEQLNNNSTGLGGGNVLIIPQLDPTNKPDIKLITTGNNVGDSFLNGMNSCDMEKARGMLTPFFLIGGGLKEVANQERQLEAFNKVISTMHKRFIRPFCSQSLKTLVKFNFPNRPSARIAPKIPLKNIARPEDRVALMQMIGGLTDHGYFNPTEEADWQMVRQMVSASDRAMSELDQKFIEDTIIAPLQKVPGAGGLVSKGRDRTKEGSIKGSGKPGRPTGTSVPQDKPR